MPAVESISVGNANSRGAKSCTPKGKPLHQVLPFERWARAVWPTKYVDALHDITKRKHRTVKYWLADEHDPSFRDAVAILRSEDGFSFLQHIMGDASPKWWRQVAKARSLGAMRRQLDEQRRRIEQLELSVD